MSETIRILHIGEEDWTHRYRIDESMELTSITELTEKAKTPYDLVFLSRNIKKQELPFIYGASKTYCVYLVDDFPKNEFTNTYALRKKAEHILSEEIQNFLDENAKYYFGHSYGEKMKLARIEVSERFTGSVEWNGGCGVILNGDYGTDFHQILRWGITLPMERYQSIDFYLEHQKDPSVELRFVVNKILNGSVGDIVRTWEFDETELQSVCEMKNDEPPGIFFMSLMAKGSGKLEIKALHDRHSRGPFGYFLPGGERYVTSKGEEIFCYFDPGDLKPPLNVFYSGYKTAEGFEGYGMMNKFGTPFLLIAEARLEGGAFYMGDSEYEELMQAIIEKYMKELGFTSDDVVLSGISMGSFGALYYGADIRPHAVIVGKPLVNLGSIAENVRFIRPGEFATALDVLNFHMASEDENVHTQAEKLDLHFWKKFQQTDWSKTKIIISHMMEDDYDPKAYDELIQNLNQAGVSIYGKGMHGRHNDNTPGIVQWFRSQTKKILKEDYGRGV